MSTQQFCPNGCVNSSGNPVHHVRLENCPKRHTATLGAPGAVGDSRGLYSSTTVPRRNTRRSDFDTPTKVRNSEAEPFIRSRKAFQGSSFSGSRSPYGPSSFGDLGPSDRKALREAMNKDGGNGVYTVMSYNTPIGWEVNGEWTIPEARYSTTTSKHQNILRRAVLG